MAGLRGIGCHCWHWCRVLPCTAWPCFPCHQRGLPGVFPSQYPQCHLPAPHSPAALLLDSLPTGHALVWAPVLLPQPPLQVGPPSSPVPVSSPQAFNPVSSRSSPPKGILVSFPVSLPSKSCFPASQTPVRSHPDAGVQSSPCTSQVFAGSPGQTPPFISSVSLTAPHTNRNSEPCSSDLSFLPLPSLPHSPAAAPVFSSFQALLSSSSSNFSTSQTTLTHFPFHSLPHQFSHCSSRQFLSTDFFLSIYFASDPLHFPKTSCSCLPCYLNWVAYFSVYFSVPPQLSRGFTENIQYPLNLIFKCFFQGLQSTWNSQGKGHQNHSMWQNKKDHSFQNNLYKNL